MIAGMQIAIGLSLMAYSCYFAWWLYKQSKTSYELEFFSDGISLRVRESNGRLLRISMSYPEMDFVEYFTPRDRESLVFHSLDGRLIEVPVDRMDQDRVHAIDLLRERGIKIERI